MIKTDRCRFKSPPTKEFKVIAGKLIHRAAPTTRRLEVTRARLQREWPHHIALSADKVRGIKDGATVRGFADAPAAALRAAVQGGDTGSRSSANRMRAA